MDQLSEALLDILRPELERIVAERVDEALRSLAEPEPWMTTEDVASYLGLSRVAVEQRARRGTLPGYKDGSRWLFRRDELDEALK